jgi:hypothetical protein
MKNVMMVTTLKTTAVVPFVKLKLGISVLDQLLLGLLQVLLINKHALSVLMLFVLNVQPQVVVQNV